MHIVHTATTFTEWNVCTIQTAVTSIERITQTRIAHNKAAF